MNKKISSIFVLSFYFLSAGLAFAQGPLTWQECVQKAKKNHPDLISAAEEVKQAKSDKDINIATILPQVTGSVSGTRSRTKSKTAGKTKTKDYSFGVTGEQLVFDGFKTTNDISNAVKLINAQEYNYLVVSSNIRLELRSAFVELLKTQELTFITQEIAERRQQNLKLIELRYEAGREHKGALLTAQADLAKAEFEVEQAKRNISLAQRELSKELGLDKMIQANVSGDFSVVEGYSAKPDLEYFADNSPFLKELIARKDAARYNLQSAQANLLPKVYLGASVGKTDDSWPPRDNEWSTTARVSIPMFEGTSSIAQIYKAKSQLKQAQADQRSGRDSALVTLETTWKDFQDSIANVSVQEKFLNAAKERAKISSAQYETGLISFDSWVIIEDNLVNAKKAFLNAQADMLTKEAYWVQAIGGTLDYDEE
ncbi:MAG: TolC family protein [Candidatus Omnitrophota bacterium]